MPKTTECMVRPEEAAELLGIDAQTLRLCLQCGYYGDIGRATKTSKDNECYTYVISKFQLYQYLGLDVSYSIQETLELVRQGKPPFIKQVPVSIENLLKTLDAQNEIKKGTS